jgi:hypothetical protein
LQFIKQPDLNSDVFKYYDSGLTKRTYLVSRFSVMADIREQ